MALSPWPLLGSLDGDHVRTGNSEANPICQRNSVVTVSAELLERTDAWLMRGLVRTGPLR